MYEGDFFKTAQEAIEKGIREYSYDIEADERHLVTKEKEVQEVKDRISRTKDTVNKFTSMLEINKKNT